MTNFAACRSKRSFAKQNAIRETQSSRATDRVAQSVISGRLPFQSNANGNQTSEWYCRASIYSGNSSSTLSRASIYPQSNLSIKSNCNEKYSLENCCCNRNIGNHHQSNQEKTKKIDSCEQLAIGGGHNKHSNQSDQTSVISLNRLNKADKCGLCKTQIKFFREEFICGHAFHGECLWRYEKLNPTYDKNQCPKNCLRRLMMVKRTRSIESRSSTSSCSSSSSSSN